MSNIGDVAAAVTIAAPGGEFSRRFGEAGEATVLPGASVTGEVGYLPLDLGTDAALADVTVTGPRCGLASPRMTLGGSGVAGTGVMVQGGPIEFGRGAAAIRDPEEVRIKNPNARQHAPAHAIDGDDNVESELVDIAKSSDGEGLREGEPSRP